MRRLLSVFLLFNAIVLNTLALDIKPQGYQYLSPVPNARHVAPQAVVIIRFNQFHPARLTDLSQVVRVSGNVNGQYTGKVKIARDNKTIIFDPVFDFLPGETITVTIQPDATDKSVALPQNLTYNFEVSLSSGVFNEDVEQTPIRILNQQPVIGEAQIMTNGVSVPSDFPPIEITVNDNPDSGKIFINSRDYPPYQLILENSGDPYWYWKVPDDRRDFKPQPNGWLTMMIRNGPGDLDEGYIALDQNHEYVKTFYASNGYFLDEHEMIMLENGGYLLIGRKYETVDMSQYVSGGQKNATVRETCIQEYTAADELIFEWRAWDHFDIRDVEIENLQGNSIRFPHMNAIFIDEDGHILLSSRHLSEVTKIHRQTGEIIWRLSGAHNDFTFVGDQFNGFRNQHAVRSLGNGHYTVYDNGNLHNPPTSRAVEYELDTDKMTATLVWEYRNEWPQYHSHYMGNAQRLPNGNTLINWAIGELPKLTEVRPNGEKAYEMWFSNGTHCYRTFRYPWNGVNKRPYLVLESGSIDVTLIFNQFGDKNVDYYKIYSGTSPSPQAVLDTSKLTLKKFSDFQNGQRYYFRVTAIMKDGSESDFSNEVSAIVNIIQPGDNIAVNGDFSMDYYGWTWEVSGSASAQWLIENGESHIAITSPGDQYYNVQLRQNGVPLIQGKKYVFEFDARASAPKAAEIKVGQDVSPWINYSKIGYTALSTNMKHFTFNFTMDNPSDYNARIVFNMGVSTHDVYIDNISLKEVVETGIDKNIFNQIPASYSLEQNFPNPFNPHTNIQFTLRKAGNVQLTVFDIMGRTINTILRQNLSAGRHQYTWYGKDDKGTPTASGIYYYRLTVQDEQGKSVFSNTRKMILIR